MPLPHRVRRLSFEVRAGSPEEALAIRKELRDQLGTALIAALERAFDQAGSPDEIVHVPRLEIEARISGAGEVAGALAQRIEQELGRQLAVMRATAGPVGSPALSAGPSGFERAAGAGAGGAPGGGAGPPEREPAASPQARARMLNHYLETGSLPWPLANVGSADVRTELQEAASAELPEVLERLTGEPVSLRARVAFWFRWLQLLPDERWPVLARAAAASSGDASARLAEIVAALSGEQAASLSRYARLQLGAAAIALTRQAVEQADATELAAIVLHALGGAGAGRAAGGADAPAGGAESHASAPAGGATGHASSLTGGAGPGDDEADMGGVEEASVRAASELTSRLPEPAAAAFRAWLAAPSRARRAGAPASSEGAQARTAHGGAAPVTTSTEEGSRRVAPSSPPPWPPDRGDRPEARAERDPGSAAPVQPRSEAVSAPAAAQPRPEAALAQAPRDARVPPASGAAPRAMPFGQMVHHAGLVLLHPFLARFFEGTGVKEAGTPALSPGELPRAAALLHLLATGEEEAFELDLGFIKVLLGLPLDAQLPISAGLLRASDREEVEALLAAVIGHWRALKSTSVQGLRGSFLQRHGLLREEDQGFRLQVEPAPFDMLLGHLPWGIGTVKLSWMKKAIFTDWPAP